jgi:uncharacterized membrane protein
MNKNIKIIFGVILFLNLLLFAKVNPVLASKLFLNPPFGSVDSGKDLKVDIVVNGDSELVDGVDAVIKYDSSVLSVKEIKEGSFFGKYPLKKDTNGTIRITALGAKDGVKLYGDIVVASLTFDVLDSGQTKINFDFTKDSTRDSNVAAHGSPADLLTEVSGGSYSVTATQEEVQKAAAKKSKGSPSPLLIFIIILLIIAGGVYYYIKKRKPKEDVYVPEPFPMDEPPKT